MKCLMIVSVLAVALGLASAASIRPSTRKMSARQDACDFETEESFNSCVEVMCADDIDMKCETCNMEALEICDLEDPVYDTCFINSFVDCFNREGAMAQCYADAAEGDITACMALYCGDDVSCDVCVGEAAMECGNDGETIIADECFEDAFQVCDYELHEFEQTCQTLEDAFADDACFVEMCGYDEDCNDCLDVGLELCGLEYDDVEDECFLENMKTCGLPAEIVVPIIVEGEVVEVTVVEVPEIIEAVEVIELEIVEYEVIVE